MVQACLERSIPVRSPKNHSRYGECQVTGESKDSQLTGDARAGGERPSAGRDPSVLESKIKLWTAIVTLLGVVAGFAYTSYQLLHQSRDLEKIEQNFSSLEKLRKALTMPLEGLWDYKVEYMPYFGEKLPLRVARGNAAFIWHGSDSSRLGYSIFIGAGVREIGKDRADAIVTYVIEFFLDTDQSGNPMEGCSATGIYISRTTSEPKFAKPSDTEVEITNCKPYFSAIHTINKLTFKYQTKTNDPHQQSAATVTFERR